MNTINLPADMDDFRKGCLEAASYFAKEERKTLADMEAIAEFSVEDGQWTQEESDTIMAYFKEWWGEIGEAEYNARQTWNNTPREWVITMMDTSTPEYAALILTGGSVLKLDAYKGTPLLRTLSMYGTRDDAISAIAAEEQNKNLTLVGLKALDA